MFEQRTGLDILATEVKMTVKDDVDTLNAYLKGCGWAYWCAAICCLPITIIKLIRNIFRTSTWAFKTPIKEKNNTGIGLSSRVFKTERNSEILEQTDGNYNFVLSRNEAEKAKKTNKPNLQEACSSLRSYLLQNNNKLKGTILHTTFPKITGEELLQYTEDGGIMSKSFMVQRITFGNEINALLKLLFKVSCRKMRGQNMTYVVLKDNEILELEQRLRDMFMAEITISLRKTEIPCT